MLFLGIISWIGASRFNGGGGCFSDGRGFIFKWGCTPWGGTSDLMEGGIEEGGGSKKIIGWGACPHGPHPTPVVRS